jgi:hypothetical protein
MTKDIHIAGKVIDMRKWKRPRDLSEPHCAIPLMVTPTQHEKCEWACVAQAAYRCMCNDIGHTFSVAASLPNGGQMTVQRFDELQANVCRQSISDSWLGNLRECLAHLV